MDALQALIFGEKSMKFYVTQVLVIAMLATVISTSVKAEEVEKVFGEWTYKSRTDALDGSTTHQAYVFDKSDPVGILGIQCDKAGDPRLGQPYIKYLQTKTFFGSKGLYPVKYRVDANPMVEQDWVVRDQTIYTSKEFFVTTMSLQMKEGRSLIIEAFDYRFRPHRNTFSLSGANKAISAVEEGCKVK
jgi:hypothetical protein